MGEGGRALANLLWPEEIDERSAVGGKAKALARLSNAGLPVPEWFVVLPDATAARTKRDTAQSGNGEAAPEVTLTADAATALESALARLRQRCKLFAVRSSAIEEDSAARSFAGQLESFVAVRPADVAERVLQVGRSGFTDRVKAYRLQAGLTETPRAPAVVVQCMIEGSVSGVAFSADPVSGRRAIAVVAAVRGLGGTLVSGETDADTWYVGRGGEIVEKRVGAEPVLEDDGVVAVADLARKAERLFGRPQDIEWTATGKQLYLLQSRPITALSDKPDPDGALILWDNANIVENYGGVITPMTFSFIRYVYEQVYIAFVRLLGVSDRAILANENAFRCMVGLVEGRVYYNLLNWYRILALFPGYRINRQFLEQMLGLGATSHTEAAEAVKTVPAASRTLDALRFAHACTRILYNYLFLDVRIRNFHATLDDIIGLDSDALADLRPDELVARYRAVEQHLKTKCGVPALNDFAVMVVHGLLRRLTGRWFGEEGTSLCNDLLSGEKESVSAELTAALVNMAKLASSRQPLVAALVDGDKLKVEREMRAVPDFEAAYLDYMQRFGCRMADELKLESPSLEEDPTPMFRTVGQLVGQLDQYDKRDVADAHPLRQQAEDRVAAILSYRPLRRAIFGRILATARTRLHERERLRFARARIFGQARRIIAEIGKRFAAQDLLEDPRDVLYLEIDEVLAFVEGWSTTVDLKALVALRKDEHKRYEAALPPPNRFETHGMVHIGRTERGMRSAPVSGVSMHGIACCPGTVRGQVRLVRDPRVDRVEPGDIIVAERTDPGWSLIFPSASGLLVERGNLLSHSAIVAREFGLPTVVSLPGLTHWLQDGDIVEMDGSTGQVTRLRDD